MKKITLFTFVFLFFIFSKTFSQEGHIYLTNFKTNKFHTDSKIFALEFNNHANAFLANRKGVAIFDGNSWSSVDNMPANVFSLKADSSGQKIYAGIKDEYGYISRKLNGQYHYTSIKKFPENTCDFTKIIITKAKTVFYGDKNIYFQNKDDDSDLFNIKSEDYDVFTGFFMRNGILYVNVKNIGVHMLLGNKLELIEQGDKFKDARIFFSVKGNYKNIILGTNENKIYIFDGKKFKSFAGFAGISKFLEENILWDGIDYSKTYFAVITLTGGCVIINKLTGKIEHTINYQTGLPDDEIYSIAKDGSNGIWLSHEHGISRFDLNIQMRSYSSYPGIYGNINDVLLKDEQLYIATNEGVYNFRPVKDFKEIEKLVYLKKNVKRGLFRRKKEVFTRARKTEYAVQSIKNKFAPIKNFNYGCKQLYNIDSTLLAVSDYGLFEINNSVASPIIEDVYVNSILKDKETNAYFAASLKGIVLLRKVEKKGRRNKGKTKWKDSTLFTDLNEAVYSLIQDDSGNLIFGTNGKAFLSKKNADFSFAEPVELIFPVNLTEPINIRIIDNVIHFIQSVGIFIFNERTKSIAYKNPKNPDTDNFQYILGKDYTWLYKNDKWSPINTAKKYNNKKFMNLFDDIRNIGMDYNENLWIINNSKELIKIMNDSSVVNNSAFQTHICSLTDKNDSTYSLIAPVIEYKNNALTIEVTAPFWIKPEGTVYQTLIEGLDNNEKWSKPSEISTITLRAMPAGVYTLRVRAKNILGQISNEAVLKFSVLKPFWQTTDFYFACIGAFLFLTISIYILTIRRLRKKKKILEKMVDERTAEIREKNTELRAQKQEIQKKNNDIIAGINYASRIQTAILPTENSIKEFLPEYFILFKPKDIVSGDFYWFKQINNFIIIATVDCTGHGVPGAFMSMLGSSFLNETVTARNLADAGQILNQLRIKIKNSLNQTGKKGEQKDGMDMSFYIIDTETQELQFSGAYNPLYIIPENENISLERFKTFEEKKSYSVYTGIDKESGERIYKSSIYEIRGDRQPLSIYTRERDFNNHKIQLHKGDVLYTFSDGYVDQFGGERGTRFKKNNFKNLLLSIHEKPMKEQKQILENKFDDWRGEYDQIDDVLVIGVKIDF